MEGEMGSGARIAIALIVLGVLITVVFTILGFTRSTTNQGLTTVQNSLESMQLSVYDDYDQQILSGSQVRSAIKLFEGRPLGIVVRTKAQMSASANTGHNYGALFIGTNTATHVAVALVKGTNDVFYTRGLLVGTDGTMQYNLSYLLTKRSGTVQFIRPTAKFLAELVKDTTGTIVGVVFTQQ